MASFTPKMIAVYTSLVAAVESVWPRGKGQEGETWGSVYLPNASGHGLTDRAFAGVLGHLKKHGLFEPSRGNGGADGLFGEVLLSNNYEGLVQWGTPEERAAQGLEPLPVVPQDEYLTGIQHAKTQKPTPAELRGKAALVTPPGRDAWSVVAGTAPKAKPATAPTVHDEPIRLTDNPENLITAPVYVYWCRPTQHPQDGLRVLVCINVKEIGTAPQEDDGIRKGWWTTGAGWQIEGLNGSPKWIGSLVLGWCRLPNAPWAAAAGAPATLPHTAQQTLDHYAARKWEDE